MQVVVLKLLESIILELWIYTQTWVESFQKAPTVICFLVLEMFMVWLLIMCQYYVTIFPYLFLYNSTQTVAFPARSQKSSKSLKVVEVVNGTNGTRSRSRGRNEKRS